jgi:hypothetical protein
MMPANKFRAEDIRRLVLVVKKEAAARNRKVSTVDPIIRKVRQMYPTLSSRERLDYSQTALRIILGEATTPSYQSTLFAHI